MSKVSEAARPAPLAAEGILDRIAASALDEDYRLVAERRLSSSGSPRGRGPRSVGPMTWFAVILVGLLMSTAVIESQRSAPVRASTRQGLLDQIELRKKELADANSQLADIQANVDALTAAYLAATTEGRTADRRLTRLSVLAGTVPVTGPGIRITVDDAPDGAAAGGEVLDRDLQALVNGLWAAGAEAVSINNQRVTSFTPIRYAGNAITVNFRSLSRPYVVSAIGDRNKLPAAFIETPGGSTWLDLQVLYGLRFEMASVSTLTLPGLDTINLNYATRLGESS